MKNLIIILFSFVLCWDKPFSKYNTYSSDKDSSQKIHKNEQTNIKNKKEAKDKYYDFTIQNFDKLLKIENIYKEIEKYENGNVKEVNFYKIRNKYTGGRDYLKSFKYYNNGMIKNETVYNLGGFGGCSLKSYEYYENGNIKRYAYNLPKYEEEQIICENNGTEILYYENGNIYRETIWKNHALFREKFYHNDGILNYELNDGKYIYYNKDGSIREGY